jgi:tricorn protease
MELNGAMPDVTIWPIPGEMPSGVDKQLEKAVEMLKEEIKQTPKTPKPRYATQDRGSPNP